MKKTIKQQTEEDLKLIALEALNNHLKGQISILVNLKLQLEDCKNARKVKK